MDILSPTANPHGVYPDLKIYAGQETWSCARDLRIPFRVIRNKEKKNSSRATPLSRQVCGLFEFSF